MSDIKGTPLFANEKTGWKQVASAYLKPNMAMMLVLGFASGLPLMMVFSKLSFWLREVGIDRSTIGFFYWVGLAYTFKFVWAPVVDSLKLGGLTTWLGHRRSWMLLAISGTMAGLLLIGISNPAENLWPTLIGALILAYSGATLDISVDAWRIESAPDDRQANMAAVYTLGYRLAIMFAGVGLIIADNEGWFVAYASMAAAMGVVALIVMTVIKEPEREAKNLDDRSFGVRFAEGFIMPFIQFFQRFGVWLIPVMLLVGLYRLSDFTMGVMASPLYADIGYTKSQVGYVSSFLGPWILVAGGFLGGLVAVKWGLMRALFIGAIITIATNGAFSFLAGYEGYENPPFQALLWIVSADNFAAGFVGTAFIAYLSSLTERKFAATQYALLSSLYAFFCKFIAGFSGVLADAVGYESFFLITAAYGIPAIILILIISIFGPAAIKGRAPIEAA